MGREWKENNRVVSGKEAGGGGFGGLAGLKESSRSTQGSLDSQHMLPAKLQAAPSGFSLASLAQQYTQSESPPGPTCALEASGKSSNPTGPIGISLSMLPQQQQQQQQQPQQHPAQGGSLSKAAINNRPKDTESNTQTLPDSCSKQLSLSDLAREQTRLSVPQSTMGTSLSSLAGDFTKSTDTNIKAAASGLPSLSDMVSVPSSTKPIACPGVSLGALAQQQQELKHSSNSPSFQGSPSLSDLARQHMDGKTGEAARDSSPQQTFAPSLSLAAQSIGKQPFNATQKPSVQNFSLSSFIQKQEDTKGETPSMSSLSRQHLGKDRVEKPGADSQFSLAALAQSHSNNNTKSFTSGLSTGISQTLPPTGFTPTNVQTDRSKPLHLEKKDSIFGTTTESTDLPKRSKGTSNTEPGKTHSSKGKSDSITVPLGHSQSLDPPPGFKSPSQNAAHLPMKPAQAGSSPRLGTINLAELASRHGESYQKDFPTAESKKTKCLKSGIVRPFCVLNVKTAKPSLFGQAICVGTSCRKTSSVPSKQANRTHPKFSYKQQISYDGSAVDQDVRSLVPFSFSTPSPDDIIKAKQRGAFTRNGERE